MCDSCKQEFIEQKDIEIKNWAHVQVTDYGYGFAAPTDCWLCQNCKKHLEDVLNRKRRVNFRDTRGDKE